MINPNKHVNILLGTTLVLSLLAFPQISFAYLDPGSGSLLIQVLLGGIAGLAVAWKLMWSRFKSLFSSRSDVDAEKTKEE